MPALHAGHGLVEFELSHVLQSQKKYFVKRNDFVLVLSAIIKPVGVTWTEGISGCDGLQKWVDDETVFTYDASLGITLVPTNETLNADKT